MTNEKKRSGSDLLKFEEKLRAQEGAIERTANLLKEQKTELKKIYYELRAYICDMNQIEMFDAKESDEG